MRKQTPLRVLGTPDTLIEQIRLRAEQDLQFPIAFEPLDGIDVQQRAVMEPGSFDVLDHWSVTAELAWTAGTLAPIRTDRIDDCDVLLGISDNSPFWQAISNGKGTAPGRKLFVQPDGTLSKDPTGFLSMMPTVHNMDSFGYCVDQVDAVPEQESWGWLLSNRFRGRIALTAHPSIGIVEVALAAQALGLIKFNDVGNLTVDEIDRLVEVLIDLKRRGHFAGLWASTDEIVQIFEERNVILSTIWSQGIMALRARKFEIRNANPREGYRGWLDGLALSAALEGEQLDHAYRFLNWWQSGWPGSVMARYGIYTTRPDKVEKQLAPAEWAYWYAGKPASEVLFDNSGSPIVRAGQSRNGGSYETRLGAVVVWNTVMNEHNYVTRKWNEFVLALNQ